MFNEDTGLKSINETLATVWLFARVGVGDGIKYYLCPVMARSWQTPNICRQPRGWGEETRERPDLGNSRELLSADRNRKYAVIIERVRGFDLRSNKQLM